MRAARPRVLVVDDEPAVRGGVAEALECEGYAVLTAPNGAAALDLLLQELPDLLITDLMMPVLDGLGLIAAYRQTLPPHVPIIVMTTAGHTRQCCDEARADGCLPKPFDLDDLLDCVAEHVGPA